MLRKALLVITALSLCAPCSAGTFAANGLKANGLYVESKVNRSSEILHSLLHIGGLTFYKDFEASQLSLNADFSMGGSTATFTRSSGAGSYVDSSGTVISFSAGQTNVPRYAGGYYDATGFHSANGLMMEAMATNLCEYSYTYANAAWDVTNISVSDASSVAPDATANASTLSATSAEGTILLHTAVTARTYSVWLKRAAGTGQVYITADSGATYTAVALLDGWARFQVTAASASQKCGIKISTSGDEVYAWVSQFETSPYATSTIVNASSSLTRNAETLRYASKNNRTEQSETLIVSFTPWSDFTNDGIRRYLDHTDTKQRRLLKFTTNGDVTALPNGTDFSTVTATTQSFSVYANTKYSSSAVYTTSSPNVSIYLNGKLKAESTTNTWDGTNPSNYFYIGCDRTGANQINGIISQVVAYGSALSSANVELATSAISIGPLVDKIMPLGDSITRYTAEDDYSLMYSRLDFVGPYNNRGDSTTAYIQHAGYTGDQTTDIIARIGTNLAAYLSTSGKKVILLHIGTNDITGSVTEADSISNIESILNTIKAFDLDIKIYVALIIPRNDSLDSDTTSFNSALNTMLSSYELTHPGVYTVDMNSAFKANPNWVADYILDNVHPSAAGRAVMATAWNNAMLANGD